MKKDHILPIGIAIYMIPIFITSSVDLYNNNYVILEIITLIISPIIFIVCYKYVQRIK